MRALAELIRYATEPLGDDGGDVGAFLIPFRRAVGPPVRLRVIASTGMEWDHVSVSVSGATRTPTWAEMEFVKRLFFRPDETAMQLHVPPKDHINCHPWTLHLWRPQRMQIPRPPDWMV